MAWNYLKSFFGAEQQQPLPYPIDPHLVPDRPFFGDRSRYDYGRGRTPYPVPYPTYRHHSGPPYHYLPPQRQRPLSGGVLFDPDMDFDVRDYAQHRQYHDGPYKRPPPDFVRVAPYSPGLSSTPLQRSVSSGQSPFLSPYLPSEADYFVIESPLSRSSSLGPNVAPDRLSPDFLHPEYVSDPDYRARLARHKARHSIAVAAPAAMAVAAEDMPFQLHYEDDQMVIKQNAQPSKDADPVYLITDLYDMSRGQRVALRTPNPNLTLEQSYEQYLSGDRLQPGYANWAFYLQRIHMIYRGRALTNFVISDSTVYGFFRLVSEHTTRGTRLTCHGKLVHFQDRSELLESLTWAASLMERERAGDKTRREKDRVERERKMEEGKESDVRGKGVDKGKDRARREY